jgi:hypothetical protein
MIKNIVLFILFLVVVIVGIYLLKWDYYNKELDTAERASVIEIKLTTKAIGNMLEYVLDDAARDLNILSDFFRGDTLPEESELTSVFQTHFKKNSYLMNLWFLDKYGIKRLIVPKKYSDEVDNDYSFRNYFKAGKKSGRTTISEVIRNYREKGTEMAYYSLVILKGLYDNSNNFYGAIGSDIDIVNLSKLISTDLYSETKKKHISVFCVDTVTSKIFMGPNDRKLYDLIREIAKDSKLENVNKTLYTHNNKKYFAASSTFKNENFNLRMIGISPYGDIMSFIPSFQYKLKAVSYVAIISIVFILVLILYNGKIRKKLKKDLNIKINKVKRYNEVKKTLNTEQTDNLKQKINNLKKIISD